jgi:LacI family transcriptional regulator
MNINEIAKHAGVSTATVSRTINGSSKVKPETAEKVWRVIHSMGYHPSSYAQALASGKSHLIGLIISDITNPFFPELVRSFEEISLKNGFDVIVANTGYDSSRTAHSVRRMIQRKTEGVAVLTSEMDPGLVHQLEAQHIPVVFLDTAPKGSHAGNIKVNYGMGIMEAMDHIVGLGHRRIGYIGGPMKYASARSRRRAFIKCLRKYDIQMNREFIQRGNFKTDGGKSAMERMLKLENRPTAVLAANDLSAIGAMHAALRMGMRVPEDISIIGFDDIDFSQLTQPPLTTIRLSRRQLSERAFDALSSVIHGEAKRGRQYEVETHLVVRESTAKCREVK